MKLVPIKGFQSLAGNIDEHANLGQMQSAMPVFFRNKHGERETFTVYRGQLIVRNTLKFTGIPATRMTAVYLFFVDGEMANDCICISTSHNLQSIDQAKKLIDATIAKGTYA